MGLDVQYIYIYIFLKADEASLHLRTNPVNDILPLSPEVRGAPLRTSRSQKTPSSTHKSQLPLGWAGVARLVTTTPNFFSTIWAVEPRILLVFIILAITSLEKEASPQLWKPQPNLLTIKPPKAYLQYGKACIPSQFFTALPRELGNLDGDSGLRLRPCVRVHLRPHPHAVAQPAIMLGLF